jgi:hypothetical protein
MQPSTTLISLTRYTLFIAKKKDLLHCSAIIFEERNFNNLSCRSYWHYVEGSRDRCMARRQEVKP